MTDYLSRVVADSLDREAWLAERPSRIGASDVAKYAKPESIPSYVRSKVAGDQFLGNAHTRRGNQWERPALSGHGFEQNTLMIHAARELGSPMEPSVQRVTPAALDGVRWPTHITHRRMTT